MAEKRLCPQGHQWEETAHASCPYCAASSGTGTQSVLWPPRPPLSAPTLKQSGGAWSRPSIPSFDILEELGHGGMGVVFKARHEQLGRLVALKMIQAGAWADKEELQRFRSEAQAVAQLRSSLRNRLGPGSRILNGGFRVARTLATD